MNVGPQIGYESPKEFFYEAERHIGGVWGIVRSVEDKNWAVAEIDDDASESFVHGHVGVTVSLDACFVAEGFPNGVAEDDAGVFDGVVTIDFKISVDVDGEVDERVLRKQREHVIEKRESGGYFAFP